VDSHCHLDFPDFAGELDAVIARARAAGVTRMVTICTRLEQEPEVRALAEAHQGLYYAAGIHPMRAAEDPPVTTEALVALARHPKFVGIGETGLDYHYDRSDRDRQRRSFRAHIDAARETGLPLVVHTRNAEEDTAAILAEEMQRGSFPLVIHCFTSSQWLADACLELGAFISLSGIVTFRNAADLREVARRLPAERLLVETDAPFLAPVPVRGRTAEPAFVAHTARFVAGLRGMDFDDFAALTSANARRLFRRVAG
jgi:TatD DNase family protein